MLLDCPVLAGLGGGAATRGCRCAAAASMGRTRQFGARGGLQFTCRSPNFCGIHLSPEESMVWPRWDVTAVYFLLSFFFSSLCFTFIWLSSMFPRRRRRRVRAVDEISYPWTLSRSLSVQQTISRGEYCILHTYILIYMRWCVLWVSSACGE